MKKIYILLIAVVLCIFQQTIFAQEKPLSVEEMDREQILNLTIDELLEMNMEELLVISQKLGISIDELLKMKTSVASKSSLTPRETPGIISIITGEEILKSGARDLIDVLRLVPGFDFGYDVQGVVGAGLRGNWVHEGKMLMLIDGQEMNEISYNNIAFGNHFPVDQILKIEIIRGPGSAIYGGNAELGVVNILTKNGGKLHGIEASAVYGQMQNSYGRTNFNLNAGTKIKDWDISAKGFYGNAIRSDQLYYKAFDTSDDTVNLSEEGNKIGTAHINFGAQGKKLSMRLIYESIKQYFILRLVMV